MRGASAVAASAILVTFASCSSGASGDASRSAVSVREEGGVTIVEHSGVEGADSTAWSIDPEPVLGIGTLDGPAETVFGQIVGVVLRRDGSIVVADGQVGELRVFDDAGEPVLTVGRRGEGPGEFGNITGLVEIDGDSVAVISDEGRRVDLVGPDFEFVRRFQARLPREEMSVDPPLSSDDLEGFFGDGQALMSDFRSCGVQSGLCQDSVRFLRLDHDGSVTGRFGTFAHGRRESHDLGITRGAWYEPHPQPIWVVHRDRFYYADGIRFEVRIYRPDGTLERRVRVDRPSPTWSRAEVWPPRSEPVEGDDMMRQVMAAMEEVQASAALPDTMPSINHMVVDATGHLWVREYLPPAVAREIPHRWWVFDRLGVLRYVLRSVPGLDGIGSWSRRPSAQPIIGDDEVVVVTEDDLGVQRVIVYRLLKRP